MCKDKLICDLKFKGYAYKDDADSDEFAYVIFDLVWPNNDYRKWPDVYTQLMSQLHDLEPDENLYSLYINPDSKLSLLVHGRALASKLYDLYIAQVLKPMTKYNGR